MFSLFDALVKAVAVCAQAGKIQARSLGPLIVVRYLFDNDWKPNVGTCAVGIQHTRSDFLRVGRKIRVTA